MGGVTAIACSCPEGGGGAAALPAAFLCAKLGLTHTNADTRTAAQLTTASKEVKLRICPPTSDSICFLNSRVHVKRFRGLEIDVSFTARSERPLTIRRTRQ